MNYYRWLTITIAFTITFLLIIVFINFYIDTYGVRLSLFSINNEVDQIKSIKTVNQHIFNPEYIFRYPNRFDSFIFGSSRIGVIDPGKINAGKFYNMSYPAGLPSEHLSILKAFLQKGIKIKTVIIGLDDFCFTISPKEHEQQLLTIMHPSVTGRSLSNIFLAFFFRVPNLFEIANVKKLLFYDEGEEKFRFNEKGLHLFWFEKEKEITLSGKALFLTDAIQVSPGLFNEQLEDDAFSIIRELISLSEKNNFKLIIFFNPFNSKIHIKYAKSMLEVKLKLASMIDFYDFSGLNSVTLNNLNYYEESHYRYLVGDMIVKRIFGDGDINIPRDFGVLVTGENVNEHIAKQKRDLEKYLTNIKK